MPDFVNDPVNSTAEGTAVFGDSTNAFGVFGKSVVGATAGVSDTWVGVYGETNGAVNGPAGVWGEGKEGGWGVKGHARGDGTAGVAGFHLAEAGAPGPGVLGESKIGHGVQGITHSTTGGVGVFGEGRGGAGVIGTSEQWHGVFGTTSASGESGAAAVWGENTSNGSGVVAHSKDGAGLFAKSEHGSAAIFEGKVEVHGDIEVTGDIRLLGPGPGDIAELFAIDGTDADSAQRATPGTVMSADDDGTIKPSSRGYDRRVVGVLAGAGPYRPGLILEPDTGAAAQPIAMIGRVQCKADASFGAIDVGDLLTTSPHAGFAMKAEDPVRAFGAVIGKALGRLADGQALVPVLVTLQ
jgi:hypothetical protein